MFKTGQKVKCTRARGSNGKLIADSVYTVKRMSGEGSMVILEEASAEGAEWFAVRFDSVEDKKITVRTKADVDALHRAIDVQRLKELNTYLMQAVDSGEKVEHTEHMEFNSLLIGLLRYN